MTTRTNPPFRADHVGSLLRPTDLIAAREEHRNGRITAAQLRTVEDSAITRVVDLQQEIGLHGVTDGEYRRGSWHMDFIYRLGGVVRTSDKLTVQFRNADGDIDATFAGMRVSGRVKLSETIFGDDFSFLKSVVKATPKLSIPSPSMVHYRAGRASIDEAVYPEMDAFYADLAAAYADEIAALGKLGCIYLQLDDTSLAHVNDRTQWDYIRSLGGEPERQHLTYIKLVNAALAKRPAGMTVCTHLCRGNYRSSWVAAGGYDHVAEALFNELAVDGYFLEYDDDRSGGFEPLRFVPPGKTIVLGLVTTKKGATERKDELKRRIDEAAKYVPLDQLCLSPQCGFASTVEGNDLTVDDEIAKLRLVAETAREVWG